MRRLAIALIALLLLRGDMYQDASNAKLPEARVNILPAPASGQCLIGTGSDWTTGACGSGGAGAAPAGMVFAESHGVVCNSTTDTTTTLQAAIDATQALNSNASGTLVLPPGICRVSGTLNITRGIRITGSGVFGLGNDGGTAVRTWSTTADVFSVTANSPAIFDHFRIDTGSIVKTAGAGIRIAGPTGITANTGSIISHMQINRMWDAIVMSNAFAHRVHDNRITDSEHNGLTTIPTDQFPDGNGGGSQVHDNAFFHLNTGLTCNAGIQYGGSGHYSVTGNTFIGCDYGVLMNLLVGPTGTLKIGGNSLEDQHQASIAIKQTAIKNFGNILITGNEFSNIAAASNTLPQGAINFAVGTPVGIVRWLNNVVIANNVFNYGGTSMTGGAIIQLEDGRGISVSGNTLNAGNIAGLPWLRTGVNALEVRWSENNTAINNPGGKFSASNNWSAMNPQNTRNVAVPDVPQATTAYLGSGGFLAGTSMVQGLAMETTAGYLRSLRIAVEHAPAAGQTFTATVYTAANYGGTPVATALTCTISNPARNCTNLTTGVPLVANGVWSLQIVTSATSGATGVVVASVGYDY